ncbi:hypothetical protein [Paraliobacillus sp. JSM ZJ581]|uniref:hypothetical protein n=1 Tax=Paraliobacillus sp. JSM ZJ581 TaxID=3342118 RepID=UPI0035A8DF23
MKELIPKLLLVVLGVCILTLVLVLEINGVMGFLLATLGIFLIVVGLTLKFLMRFFVEFF